MYYNVLLPQIIDIIIVCLKSQQNVSKKHNLNKISNKKDKRIIFEAVLKYYNDDSKA